MSNLFDNNLTNCILCFIVTVSFIHQQMRTITYKPYINIRNSYVHLHRDVILGQYKHKGVQHPEEGTSVQRHIGVPTTFVSLYLTVCICWWIQVFILIWLKSCSVLRLWNTNNFLDFSRSSESYAEALKPKIECDNLNNSTYKFHNLFTLSR